jgi:hypothetical protein
VVDLDRHRHAVGAHEDRPRAVVAGDAVAERDVPGAVGDTGAKKRPDVREAGGGGVVDLDRPGAVGDDAVGGALAVEVEVLITTLSLGPALMSMASPVSGAMAACTPRGASRVVALVMLTGP